MGARVMELTFIFKRGNATLLVGHGGNGGARRAVFCTQGCRGN